MSTFISAAEAAFIAGLNASQINRLVDEHILPDEVLSQTSGATLFTRLSAAFARFYFDTDDVLQAAARRHILKELNTRVQSLPNKDLVLDLGQAVEDVNWRFDSNGISVDVGQFVFNAYVRAKELDLAKAMVHIDPEILGGIPVFVGTRLPIETVLGALDAGDTLEELQRAYPYLTKIHVEAARVFEKVYTSCGRPQKLAARHPDLAVLSRRVLRPAQG